MYYRTLEHRIKQLELVLESKADQEKLRAWLGDEYYDKYTAIKRRIKDPEYKDIYSLMSMNKLIVKKYIDNFQSSTQKRASAKSEGAELIAKAGKWKVYKITTWEAATFYGSHTKWCISGRLGSEDDDTPDGSGKDFFDQYTKPLYMDKAYYFVISGNTKYCFIRNHVTGEVTRGWTASDDEFKPIKFFERFPEVGKVFDDLPGSKTHYGDLANGTYDSVEAERAKEKQRQADSEKRSNDLRKVNPLTANLNNYSKDDLGKMLSHSLNNPTAAKKLLEYGANPDYAVNSDGDTSLIYICRAYKPSPQMIESALALINSGANVNAKSRDGWTPLLAAVNKLPLAKALIAAGANVNAKNQYGTILDQCTKATIKKLLIAKGAK